MLKFQKFARKLRENAREENEFAVNLASNPDVSNCLVSEGRAVFPKIWVFQLCQSED